MKRCRIISVITCLAILTVAADWPQWLGPNRDGTSVEIVKPWTETPSIVWRVPVGEGHSSPVVSNGRVILHHKVPSKDEEQISVFDAATGKKIEEFTHSRVPYRGQFGAGPRATPI